MDYDILKFFSQGGDYSQDEENRRIKAVAHELQRLCQLHEAESGTSKANVNSFEREQRCAETLAKQLKLWIPMEEVMSLGVPGPSGNENDTYVADDVIYKVNNLMNSAGIVNLLQRVLIHNVLFPDTAYQLHGFCGFDGRMVQPVLRQARIENAHPATQVMIDTYMAALGFTKQPSIGRFANDTYEVWDILPRNVLIDNEGDIYVVDAEIREIQENL